MNTKTELSEYLLKSRAVLFGNKKINFSNTCEYKSYAEY